MVQILDLLDTEINVEESKQDRDEWAHYAESTSVTEGYVLGTPVIAVCGKIFIPSKDPEKLRVCPICKEIVEALFL